MKPIKNKNLIHLKKVGPLVGHINAPFIGLSKNLGLLLEGNQILRAYSRNGNKAINNFLRGSSSTSLAYNPDVIEFLPPNMRYISRKMHEDELQRIKEGKIVVYDVNYPPMTKAFVKSIIDIDTALRLSKSFNKQPMRLHRGAVPIDIIDMSMFNSWTTDTEIARHFASPSGTFLTTDLPAGFPYIFMNDTKTTDFANEFEHILPPCEFKVVESALDDKSYTENARVVLRPLSLAKLLLARMKNPPKDYPRTYISDPIYEYDESMQMLERYIKRYADRGLVRFGRHIIKEAPDPEIIIDAEEKI